MEHPSLLRIGPKGPYDPHAQYEYNTDYDEDGYHWQNQQVEKQFHWACICSIKVVILNPFT